MSRIRSKNTRPERLVRSWLHRAGFRFRLHVKTLPGHPDIVLARHRAVVEVRGCFWHRHGCDQTTTPKTNRRFWEAKFRRNVARDARHERELAELGWRLFVIWECELAPRVRDETLSRLCKAILEEPFDSGLRHVAESAQGYDASPPGPQGGRP
ncbi:MAG: very short patch repair endonuclease [Kiritimatiellia bacterium]